MKRASSGEHRFAIDINRRGAILNLVSRFPEEDVEDPGVVPPAETVLFDSKVRDVTGD